MKSLLAAGVRGSKQRLDESLLAAGVRGSKQRLDEKSISCWC